MGQHTKSFIKGAAILGAAALISKLLGAIYRIPYQNIAGDIGLYVYNQVYPLYSILLILSTAGFPIAISKIVSEKLVHGDVAGAKRVFRLSAVILSITGVIFFCLLYFGAPILAKWTADDEMLTLPYQSVAFALLIVPVMASMRGYFQGYQDMMPTAISQIVEQIVRVITILFLAYWFLANGYSVYYAGAGAVFGAFTGAFAALLVLLFYWFRTRNEEKATAQLKVADQEPALQLMMNIMKLAIPIALGSLVLPLFQMVDTFTVKNILDSLGVEDSKVLKGIFDRGQPLVQFAAFMAAPLSLALVPAISEANARKEGKLIASRTELALRLTLFLGLPASVGLAVIAEPVNIFIYETNDGTLTLAVLAFTTIFSTLGVTTGGILQGLGHVMLPARNLFIGVVVKLILNYLLMPMWGITGAALATVIAYAVATFLNILAVNRYTGLVFGLKNFFIKPMIAVSAMALAVFVVEMASFQILSPIIEHTRLLNGMVALLSVIVGMFIYGLALFLSGALVSKDLEAVPKLRGLQKVLRRMGILRD